MPRSVATPKTGYALRSVARLFVPWWMWHLEPRLWQQAVLRLAPHLALLSVLSLLLMGHRPPSRVVAAQAEALSAHEVVVTAPSPIQDAPALRAATINLKEDEELHLTRQALPKTVSHPGVTQRHGVVWYTAQVGDTVEGVAARFGLQPATILWANPRVEKLPSQLLPGQRLRILPVDGVYHQVQPGETLESIARVYSTTVESIVSCPYNPFPGPVPLPVEPGTALIIPGGVKPETFRNVTPYTGPIPEGAVGTGEFIWPVSPAYGFISQWFWWGHRAVDLAGPLGSAVHAADTGYVSYAGWVDTGYGNLVVINHQNGYETYYGHFDKILVEEGQRVEKGQVLGMMGDTGRSTGPHVHFEIRYEGAAVNPFRYLPAWEGYIWW